MMKKLNIETVLNDQQAARKTLDAFTSLLKSQERKENELLKSINNGNGLGTLPENELPPGKVYSILTIKNTAIKYRLRFLPVRYFKGEFPRKVILKIQELKKQYPNLEHSLYMLAPSAQFQLEDCNKDPLLFAQTDAGNYVLIAKWGNDLNPLRAQLNFILKDLSCAILGICSLGIIAGLTLPSSLFVNDATINTPGPNRLALIISCILTASAIFSYLFFTRSQGFSKQNWNKTTFGVDI